MLAPIVRATDDLPSADPLAALFWLHRLFGDWDDDDPTCGCGATPPDDAREEAFGDQRWHDEHLAAAVAAALAAHVEAAEANALVRYAAWCMEEVSEWDEMVYPNRWDIARDRARHAEARAAFLRAAAQERDTRREVES